jgi:predicted CXXCH cytochrome family protein
LRVRDKNSPVYSLNVTKTCAKCHSNADYIRTYNPRLPVDQLEKYKTSVHGKKNSAGDVKVAECVNCHGSHDIRTAKDVKSKVYAKNLPSTCARCHADAEHMKNYKIPTDQYSKYSKSVHGIALLEKNDPSSPACNDCHGNHGAVPPGITSISKVCGLCHVLNANLFASSPHKKAFDSRKLPECETCHGSHSIINASSELLGVTGNTTCSRCHSQKENAKGFFTAQMMRLIMDSLAFQHQEAIRLVAEAEQKGMEISAAKFKLRDARQARLESRTMIHSFNEDKFREVAQKGLTLSSDIASEASKAIEDYYIRRLGLGISTLIITILALSLYLFIRRIEKRKTV